MFDASPSARAARTSVGVTRKARHITALRWIMVAAVGVAGMAAGGARAAPTADGRIVYSNNTTTPQSRVYTASTNAFAAAAATQAGLAQTFVVDRAAPTRNEHIAGYVTTTGQLYVLRWNGTAWSAEWNVAVGGAGVNGRRFDIAYENTTGNAMVVYSNNANSQLRYNVWTGTAWSYTTTTAPTVTLLRTATIPNWIKLSSRRTAGSNEIAAAVADTASDLTAIIWSGSGWGNEPGAALSTALQQTAAAGDKDAFDLAHESASGDLFVVYSDTVPANIYRTYSGGTWSGAQTLSATGRTIQSMFAVADPDPSSDRVVAGWDRTGSGNRFGVVWSGTALGTVATVGNNANTTAPPATSHQMTGAWLTAGGAKRAVVVYQSTTTTNVDYAVYDDAAGTWTTSQASTGYASGDKRWVGMEVDAVSRDAALLAYSDANSDLWAKRLVFDGSTLTWANADGGTALTAALASVATQNFSFAYDRYVRKTTIADGSNPTGLPAYVAPGSGSRLVDAFTVQTDNGTDVISAVQVTFTGGAEAGVGLVEIVSNTGSTVYGSQANPAAVQTVTLSTNTLTASTTNTQYMVRVTPKAHVDMAVPPGSVINVAPRITDITVTYSKSVGDTASSTLVIDNASSPVVTGASGTGGIGTVTANWTNPAAGAAPATDFGGNVLVIGNSVAATGTPTEGVTSYAPGDPVGADSVVCFGAISSCQKTGLGSAETYHFRIFTQDGSGNWSTGVATSGTSSTVPTTTIATGTDPTVSATWVAPGTGAVAIDAFTVTKSAVALSDAITAVEVSFAPGTAQGIGLVEIMDNGLATTFGSFSNPADVQAFTLGTAIPSTTTTTQYKIRVTPRLHASMPLPPGGAYAVTARITDVTVTYARLVNDSGSSTLNVDNASSPDATSAAATATTGTVTATWSNPAAGTAPNDFASYVVVLGNTQAVTSAPAEGTDVYTVGGVIGSDSILCVGNVATCQKTGLTEGQTYYMKVFTRDSFNNWAAGVQVSATTPNNKTLVGALSADLLDCGHVYLAAAYSFDANNSNTVTFTRGTDGTTFPTTVCSNVAGPANPRSCTDTTMVAGSTYYYRATFTDADGFVAGNAATSPAVTVPSGCSAVTPGNTTTNWNGPVAAIINPTNGARIGFTAVGFRVQVRVFSRDASAIAAVNLTTDGSNPSCAAAGLNGFATTQHVAGTNAAVYEKVITISTSGTYVLRACARNGVGEVDTEAVTITYNATRAGDGNLLVRDDSAQLCSDCHTLKTHSSETTSAQYGSWSTVCTDCHQPHRTTNLGLLKTRVAPPEYRGYVGPRNMIFRSRTGDSGSSTSGSFVTSDATRLANGNYGPCQVCHTQTKDPGAPANARWRATGNSDPAHYQAGGVNGTTACTSCHPHSIGFKAGEPGAPASACAGCHSAVWRNMDGTNAVASKHSFVGATDTGSDSSASWAGVTYLSDIPATSRSCVNMCHGNHPHAATDVGGNHEYNAYKDPTTSATRNSGIAGNTSAYRSKTDFDATAATGGLCAGCHQKPVAAGRPAIAAAAYGASAHDYVGTETTPINYAAYGTWEYVQHTGDRFQRNCTKCHANRAEATTLSVNQRSAAAVHNSDGATLLGGTKNPGASPGTFICYNCHGNGTIGTNRSGKIVYTEVAKAVSHPANTGTVHDTNTEAAATFNDGKFKGTNRHANCADCHDPHEVGPTSHVYATTATSARNAIAADSPLKGVAGVTFNYAALARWTAPAAANFSTNPVTATREYEVCFKCHSSFAFGSTPPNGISANGTATTPVETDVALEFNPANRSGHPIVTGLNNYTNSAAPKALLATQMKAPWNVNVGTQTMMCSDCHNTDAAAPAVQGPHGSAAQFMLRGPNQANWPHVSYNNWATSWCANCHNPGSNPGHANSNHSGYFCDTCHVVIPHGANMSRLIADHVRMPSRYAYNNTLLSTTGIQGFTKTTDAGYAKPNCAASCSTGDHPVPGTTVERWNN